MAALTQGKLWEHKGNPATEDMTVGAAGTYYAGSVVVRLAAGKITNVPAAGLKPAGIVKETVVITAADVTAGKKIAVHTKGLWKLPTASAAVTDENELVYVDVSAGSDNPADLLAEGAGATGDIAFGRVAKFETGFNWVDISDRSAIATHA